MKVSFHHEYAIPSICDANQKTGFYTMESIVE